MRHLVSLTLATSALAIAAVPAAAQTTPAADQPVSEPAEVIQSGNRPAPDGAPTPAADAAQAPTEQLQPDIVVTAQKRTVSLRESPVSVAVVSGDTLAKAGVTTLDDVGKTVPSLTALPANSSLRPRFTIRGVSTDVLGIGAPSGVAVMIDGVTLSPESLTARQLVDIQNVEVLRGPQSTLGGRTASIGVVNIVTKKPASDRLQGNVGFTATTDDEYRSTGFITGPLTDTLAFSLSGFATTTRFPTRNLNTGRYDKGTAEGVRGKLLWQPTENLDVTLAGNYVHSRDIGTFQAYISVDPTALFRGFVPYATALPGIAVSRDNFDYRTITTPGQNVKDQLHTLTIDYRIGDFTVSSISARQLERRVLVQDLYFENADFVAINTNGAFRYNNTHRFDLDIKGFSQEFKIVSPDLGIARFVAGLYYDQVESGYQFDRRSFGFAPLIFAANRTPNNKTYAAYARVDWKVLDGTSLITGLRINHDVNAYRYQLQTPQQTGPNLIQFTRTGSSSTDTLVGDVTVKQRLGERANTYATYSRGYKPEIYNLDGLVTATNTFVPVGREHVDSFELGFKGDFLERLLTVNLAAFYTRYNDFQVQSLDFSNPLGATTFDVRNASKASTRGFEIDSFLRPGGGLSATFSAAVVKAKYDSFPGAVCYSGQTAATGCVTANGASSQDLSGAELPRSPRFKFNAGIDQRLTLNADYNLNLGATFNYQSKINFDPNKSPRAVQPAYGILNLTLGLLPASDAYSITLFVNNVTDKHYVANITDLSGRWGTKEAVVGQYSRDAQRYAGIRFGANF